MTQNIHSTPCFLEHQVIIKAFKIVPKSMLPAAQSILGQDEHGHYFLTKSLTEKKVISLDSKTLSCMYGFLNSVLVGLRELKEKKLNSQLKLAEKLHERCLFEGCLRKDAIYKSIAFKDDAEAHQSIQNTPALREDFEKFVQYGYEKPIEELKKQQARLLYPDFEEQYIQSIQPLVQTPINKAGIEARAAEHLQIDRDQVKVKERKTKIAEGFFFTSIGAFSAAVILTPIVLGGFVFLWPAIVALLGVGAITLALKFIVQK